MRKVHALDSLLVACQELDPLFADLRDDALYLTKFYVETRYPADMPAFSRKDGEEAYGAAGRVKNFVQERLNSEQQPHFPPHGR